MNLLENYNIMSLWPSKSLFGDELVLRSIDWMEQFPWKNQSAVKAKKDRYEIRLNAKEFSPDEISVNILDGYIVIEGKHDEKKDEHGFISRQFVRRYVLPEGCGTEGVASRLSPDGVLIISVPRQQTKNRDTVIPVSYGETKVKAKL